jgi:hypothetical protein
MKTKLSREFLGLFGEYAVASELCRRGVYAQLTLGHHKQTDILVETETQVLRVSAKAKQGNEWPSVSGLSRPDDYLVLTDLRDKSEGDRPEFYILNRDDWRLLIDSERKKHPGIIVDKQNCITYQDGWKGLNIKPKMVANCKEQWNKIVARVL